MSKPESCDYNSLFIGPRGENLEILRNLICWTIGRQAKWREDFTSRFQDPLSIPNDKKILPPFKTTHNWLRECLENLCQRLQKSTEVFSPRYIPHMAGDPIIPGIVGYFAGMLCHQNNIIRAASESTFLLEREVIEELGRLVGYIKTDEDKRKIGGYLTCGGTTANFQSLWVARNKAYFAFSIREMVKIYKQRGIRLSVNVNLAGKSFDISELDDEQLSDIPPTRINELYRELLKSSHEEGIHKDEISKAEWQRNLIKRVGMRALGMWQRKPGVILTSVSSHYSVWKICEALGIGIDQCKLVEVDDNYRMETRDLEDRLEETRSKGEKVIAVVATLGTTETGAIDPLDEILDLRDEYQFLIHADAAWGGYACCVPDTILNTQVQKRLELLKEADSIVVDPHKLGYIPYSCGAVLFKDKIDFQYVASIAPYLFHPAKLPEIEFYGQYTLEGSRGGSMAASCWLAHKSIGLDKPGYGKIIGSTLQTTQRMAMKLKQLGRPYGDFIQVMNDPELNILCFRLVNNPTHPPSDWKRDNKINRRLYKDINQDREFFVSCTDELKRSESDKEAPLAIRVCIVNPLTNEYYVDKFIAVLKKFIDKYRDEGELGY